MLGKAGRRRAIHQVRRYSAAAKDEKTSTFISTARGCPLQLGYLLPQLTDLLNKKALGEVLTRRAATNDHYRSQPSEIAQRPQLDVAELGLQL